MIGGEKQVISGGTAHIKVDVQKSPKMSELCSVNACFSLTLYY